MRWLAAHAHVSCAAGPVGARAAWLTGQSSWQHSLLSPRQEAVLDALARDGLDPLRVGFPWTTAAAAGTYRSVPLPIASVRNGAQFIAARWLGTHRREDAFAHQIARHLQQLVESTTDRLVLLVGSAGAEMLTAAAPLLRVPPSLAIDVVALGPVGRLRVKPSWTVHVVQGSGDYISRLGYSGPVDAVVPGGHLSAATSPATITVVRAALRRARP